MLAIQFISAIILPKSKTSCVTTHYFDYCNIMQAMVVDFWIVFLDYIFVSHRIVSYDIIAHLIAMRMHVTESVTSYSVPDTSFLFPASCLPPSKEALNQLEPVGEFLWVEERPLSLHTSSLHLSVQQHRDQLTNFLFI